MKRAVYWSYLFVFFFVFSFGVCHAEKNKMEFGGRTNKEMMEPANATILDSKAAQEQLKMKKNCLAATIAAINLEMERYQGWIDWRIQHGDQGDLPELQESLKRLKADLAKFLAMNPEEYVLPEKTEVNSAADAFFNKTYISRKITTTAWISDKEPKNNSILHVEGMSKNGPWYHVAGIAGNDYTIVRPDINYQMTFYTVYPKQYGWMASAYVYIAEVKEKAPVSAYEYHARGQSYANKNLNDAAIADFTKAIEMESQYAEAYFHRAELLDKMGRCFEARKGYAEAIHLGQNGNLNETDLAKAKRRCTEISQMSPEGKRIVGEVFSTGGWGVDSESVKCNAYKVYLLQNDDDHEGKLILDAKESSFAITITESQLEKYPFMEFVSPYGTKTITLREVKDNQLKIVLQRNMILKKPAIYLYPSQEAQISVIHHFKGKLLNTYPAYLDDWSVIAEPNGNLRNLKDGREYKYLFWEGAYSFPEEHYQYTSGFYVKKDDYIPFLQEKLAHIGLNQNEINDFIVYWLPAMGKYNNCFVHFRINDNIDGSSVLETNPAADTTIRVFMEFSGLEQWDGVKELPEQILPSIDRKGFTLVEWGGSEIGADHIE